MVRIENDCVGCDLPCISSCPYKEVPHYYCDNCHGETDAFYFRKSEYHYDEERIDNEDYALCKDCAMEALTFDDIIEYVDEDFMEIDKRWFYCFYNNNELHKELNKIPYKQQDEKIMALSDEYVAECRAKYIKSNDFEYGIKTIEDMCIMDEFLEYIYFVYNFRYW